MIRAAPASSGAPLATLLTMLRLAQTLDSQLRSAMARALQDLAPEAVLQRLFAEDGGGGPDPQLAPASKPEFGDFQANGALPLAKPLAQPPRRIAEAIVAQLKQDPAFAALCQEPVIAGPGFINLTLHPERLAAEIAARVGDARLGVPEAADAATDAAVRASGQPAAPVIVDFSSPNIAKEMHVGQIGRAHV